MKKNRNLIVPFLVGLMFCSCNSKRNDQVTCSTSENGVTTSCWSLNSLIMIKSKLKNNTVIEVFNNKKSDFFKFIKLYEDGKMIEKLIINDPYETTISFDTKGEIIGFYQEFSNDNLIILMKMNNGNKEIQSYTLINNSKNTLLTNYLSINQKGDTINYFFLKNIRDGIQIFTDNTDFKLDELKIDSLEIIYTSNKTQNIKYSKIKGSYLPEYDDRNVEKILNEIKIPENSNTIIGELWTHNKVIDKYSYQPVYYSKSFEKRFNSFEKVILEHSKIINGKLERNVRLRNALVSTGLLTIQNGILKFSKKIEEFEKKETY